MASGASFPVASTPWPSRTISIRRTTSVCAPESGTSAISNWTLGFTFPGDQKITSSWNTATSSQSGEAVTLTNASYNGTIAAGASTTIGFQGTWASSDAAPAAFTVNGSACS